MTASGTATDVTGRAESATGEDGWWRDAVIYQIYPRSFADSDGDGMGDLNGIREHLDHIESLGVDAVWLSPFYPSPQADAGYDVADYRDVNPTFGTLADFDALLAQAHDLGLRVVIDLVPNHTSSEHAWFKAAVTSLPGSPERARYIFRDGKGAEGELPPNNWGSVFGGTAWTRVEDGTERPQWYLHLFDTRQPDLNWENPEVIAEFKDVLRFWLSRGVDGFRIDVAHGLIKEKGLPDNLQDTSQDATPTGPMWNQPGVHEIYRGWHRVLREFGNDPMLVAEAWVSDPSALAFYVRSDEMQQAFNFNFLLAGWDASEMRRQIDQTRAANAVVGATTTWVLSNHDVVRHATRLAMTDRNAWRHGIGPEDPQPDAALGLDRARAATMFILALPGGAYIYQGEELGLPEHTTLPSDVRQDPTFRRTGGKVIGRDGCRVPLPWDSTRPGLGFGPDENTWLPQPDSFAGLAADRQNGVPGSTLELYRAAIAIRRERALGDGDIAWNPSPDGVLDFTNGTTRIVLNASADPFPLEAVETVLASSDDAVRDGELLPNHAVWLDVD
ncbi:glycoside hydrolase family 13 protein [Propionibacterium sp.]|uniref:glycoside hydrolase family 13 protein n=1 Tax=Propionibacterium sp. TaxID=1977903 RepID=UPI0039EB6CA3